MTRGVVLFAHNTSEVDYFKLASLSAKRMSRFLDLPVSVITDTNSVSVSDHGLDKIITIDQPDKNSRNARMWYNKGRYKVYDLTPYDQTLLLDVDYVVNSRKLLSTFDLPSDLVCYQDSKFFLDKKPNERMSKHSLDTYWATVVRFDKTKRTNDVFKMIQRVQDNYQHYVELHKFSPFVYRNDYAFTIALRTVNGHFDLKQDAIPGRLWHAGSETKVEKLSDTEFSISSTKTIAGITKRSGIVVKDFDFHMLSKTNFEEIIND